MLLIKPVQEKEEQRCLCEQCGVVYRPDALCYKAFEGTAEEEVTLLGVCQFDLGEKGILYDLKSPEGVDDEEALFIMGRQTLNFIDLCGTHDAYLAPDCVMTDHLRYWLGFSHKDGDWHMDLRGFFEEPCKHKKCEKTE